MRRPSLPVLITIGIITAVSGAATTTLLHRPLPPFSALPVLPPGSADRLNHEGEAVHVVTTRTGDRLVSLVRAQLGPFATPKDVSDEISEVRSINPPLPADTALLPAGTQLLLLTETIKPPTGPAHTPAPTRSPR